MTDGSRPHPAERPTLGPQGDLLFRGKRRCCHEPSPALHDRCRSDALPFEHDGRAHWPNRPVDHSVRGSGPGIYLVVAAPILVARPGRTAVTSRAEPPTRSAVSSDALRPSWLSEPVQCLRRADTHSYPTVRAGHELSCRPLTVPGKPARTGARQPRLDRSRRAHRELSATR